MLALADCFESFRESFLNENKLDVATLLASHQQPCKLPFSRLTLALNLFAMSMVVGS